MKYEFLLFDADDTLLDFQKSEEQALRLTMEAYGLPYNEEILNTYKQINDGLWKAFERGEIGKDEIRAQRFAQLAEVIHLKEDGDVLNECYMKNLAKGTFLIPNAYEVCKELAKDFKLYLITNGFSFIQHARFDGSSIKEFFQDIFVSEESGYQKPQVEYFDYVAARIPEFDKSRALVIGDSLTSDMRGGIHAGIDTCWFHPSDKKMPKEIVCTYEITKLTQLYDIVNS